MIGTRKYRFISYLLASLFIFMLANLVEAASYISVSKTIRSDFDDVVNLTTGDPNDGSRDVVFRITISNTGDSDVLVHATDDLGDGQFYSADPGAPYDRDNILVPAYGEYVYDFRARYQGSNTTHGAAITSTARIIWIDGCYNYYASIDCGVHGNLTSSQTAYIHNPPPPNQSPEAKITMTSGSQTAYENQTLNLTVSPGANAHIDFSASRSSDPDGTISGYRWQISGTEVSTSKDFSYDLDEGTHQIYLTVTDNEGAEGSVGATIAITEEAQAALFDYPVSKEQYIPGSYDGRTFYYDQVHLGEDIELPEGTPIKAIGDGRIVQYEYHSGYASEDDGTSIAAVIEHDLGGIVDLSLQVGHEKDVSISAICSISELGNCVIFI